MPARSLTSGEKGLLIPIFKHALSYDDLEVDLNIHDYGGEHNSITPFGTPYMSRHKWTSDYSASSVAPSWQWVFVHEMAHVWQYHNGVHKILEAVALWFVADDYEKDAYEYDLSRNTNLNGYTFEAQAAIIADYFYVTKQYSPSDANVGTKTALSDYTPFMNQVWNSNPASTNRSRSGRVVRTPLNRR